MQILDTWPLTARKLFPALILSSFPTLTIRVYQHRWTPTPANTSQEPLYKVSREVDSPFARVEEDWSDNGTDKGETDYEREDAQGSVEVEQDGNKSTENSDANEDEGLLNVCTEPCGQNTAEARQEPAHSVGHAPNPADSHVLRTGIGFIHRIIGGLQRGLVIESENLDTVPISPFLV
ncbi:hypothetical protein B0H16DRAFT_1893032 [Mycena metata]|uniref:Uncharacterized protein n=1 Tax=Mycena metata TaxID=1033252 RepID=A0AAD7I0U5_9AGAR|nr:hypothetical protein B0H16DRAFT_1893032 [Mycena metata]